MHNTAIMILIVFSEISSLTYFFQNLVTVSINHEQIHVFSPFSFAGWGQPLGVDL